MATGCHYTEMNPLLKRLCLSQVKTLLRKKITCSPENVIQLKASSFLGALPLAAKICFQKET